MLTRSHTHMSLADPSALGPVTPEEAQLLAKLDLARLPRHVAVIMDGNGRWAERRHLPRAAGHRSGTQTARTTIETCARLKIEALTLYAFSVENWRRPKRETDFLMQLLREYLRQEMPLIQRNNIRMRFLGRARELPDGVQQDMRAAVEKTSKNTGMVLCLALNYGGRAEIVDALNEIVAQRKDGKRFGRISIARACWKLSWNFRSASVATAAFAKAARIPKCPRASPGSKILTLAPLFLSTLRADC